MPEGTVLAFDFGEKRIGVAIGESLLAQAHPLTVISIERRDERFAAIGRLIQEWQPCRLVVGYPTHADGEPHELSRRATRFANQLHGRFTLPVTLADERFTSLAAEDLLREGGVSARASRGKVDALAAQLILQSWFDQGCPDNPLSLGSSSPSPNDPDPSP